MEKSLIVKVEKSGNRFNAWDADGNKHTSSISISARKRAFDPLNLSIKFLDIL